MIGRVFKNVEGCDFEILECVKVKTPTSYAYKYKIRFLDTHGYTCIRNACNIKSGKVKNPYHKSVQGVGYLGDGKFSSKENGKHIKSYEMWRGVMMKNP